MSAARRALIPSPGATDLLALLSLAKPRFLSLAGVRTPLLLWLFGFLYVRPCRQTKRHQSALQRHESQLCDQSSDAAHFC